MQNIAAALNDAVALYNAGELGQAERLCQQIVQADPRHARALHLLGAIAFQAAKYPLAVQNVLAAIAIDDRQAAYHFTLCEIYCGLGQLEPAIASVRQAVLLRPDWVEARFKLGRLLEAGGELAGAAEQFSEALRLQPDRVDAALHLGQVLFGQGKLPEAEARFKAVTRSHPNAPWAHCGLGATYQSQGRLTEAIDCYRRAIELDPQFAEAHYNLGVALRQEDRLSEAIAAFQAAVAYRPTLVEAHLGLASAHVLLVQPERAVAASRRALELAPQSAAAFARLAAGLQLQGDLDGAIAAYRRAVELNPSDAAEHSNLVYSLNFHPAYDAASLFAEHRAWAARHAEPLTAAAAPHTNERAPERRLRVGYVSSHFREHAVSFFIEPVIARHDRKGYEVFCYSDVRLPDAVTQRFRSSAEQWRDIAAMSDAEVAELVRRDEIDILVDLAGHIGGNRLLVFARKPAPVQVTYLGYQNTTGMSAMDYRLTDEHADPPGATDEFYSERLVRLPRSFFCFQPPEPSPDVNELPAVTRGHVTFASLNHINKLTPDALRTWAKILLAVRDSRLIVLAYSGGQLARNIWDVMAREGVEPGRVEIVDKRPRYEYLRLHHEIDIALDSFPFNGHTTICDALWMGVPSIMLEGSTYASRFGGSTLRNVGLSELIACSPGQYVEIATALAGDLPRLVQLRRDLRSRMRASPLVDAVGFTRNLESAYRHMWRAWCEQDSPKTVK